MENRHVEKTTNARNRMPLGVFLTLLGASCWGLCAVAAKYLMARGIDTLWIVNFRMSAAGIIMLAYAAIRNPKGIFDIFKIRRSVIRLLLLSIFGFDVCQITYFLAIEYCNAGIATAIQQTAPVFILVFVILRDRRKPALTEVLVLLLVMLGSFLLATGGDIGVLSIPPLALLYGFASAITCTMYIMLPPPLIEKYGNFETLGWGLTLGGIMEMPFSGLWTASIPIDASIVFALVFIVLVGAVAAFGCYMYGTTIVGPVKAGIYGLIEPVVATFASLILLGQVFSASDYLGIAAILVGIIVLTLFKNKQK